MERNFLSNTLKDHGIRSRSYNYNNNNTTSKLKDPWNHISQSYAGEDQDSVGVGGFSWPPRSYNCSFCKREFRSAQALGGHMNVHRRDRARLRQSPPIVEINGQCPNPTTTSFNLNLLPNNCSPNPSNVSTSMTCTTLSSMVSSSSPFSALSSSSPSFASPREEDKWVSRKNVGGPLLIDPLSQKNSGLVKMGTRKSCFVPENLEGFKYQEGCEFLKKAEIVRLDLEIGVLGDHSKDDLDLELRLGYP